MFKKVILLSLFIFIFGCAGIHIFPKKDLCTPEEQESSLIYKAFDPQTADFTLALGTAAYLDKHKDKLPEMTKIYKKVNIALKKGLNYNLLFDLVKKEFGSYTYVVVSRFVNSFKGISLPISECDKRLILLHIEKQLELFELMK